MSNRKSIFFYAGFFGSHQITFIILKLCGAITWNWWLVMIPTIAAVLCPVCVLGVLFAMVITQSFFKKW